MRVAIVVNGFPTLSESFIFNKVRGLQAAGVDTTVLVHQKKNDMLLFRDGTGETADRVVRALISGGTTESMRRTAAWVARRPGPATELWKSAQNLYGGGGRAIRAWLKALPLATKPYDCIHFEFSGIAVAYLDAMPLLRPASLIVSCRGSAEQIKPLTNPERAAGLNKVFSLVDRVHCVSHNMVETTKGYGLDPSKTFVNHPAIDLATFSRSRPYANKKTGPYCLVSTGRLHWKKGFEYGLAATRALLDEGYQVFYEIIGGGAEEEHLRFTIHDLALQDHVRLRGRLTAEEIRTTLEQADVYLSPSLSEGLSNSVLEAMAMELPVVATGIGGMNEAITDGSEGLLVPARQPVEMAARIEHLLEHHELRRRIGRAARRRIEQSFDLRKQVQQFVSEYASLCMVSIGRADGEGRRVH